MTLVSSGGRRLRNGILGYGLRGRLTVAYRGHDIGEPVDPPELLPPHHEERHPEDAVRVDCPERLQRGGPYVRVLVSSTESRPSPAPISAMVSGSLMSRPCSQRARYTAAMYSRPLPDRSATKYGRCETSQRGSRSTGQATVRPRWLASRRTS